MKRAPVRFPYLTVLRSWESGYGYGCRTLRIGKRSMQVSRWHRHFGYAGPVPRWTWYPRRHWNPPAPK